MYDGKVSGLKSNTSKISLGETRSKSQLNSFDTSPMNQSLIRLTNGQYRSGISSRLSIGIAEEDIRLDTKSNLKELPEKYHPLQTQSLSNSLLKQFELQNRKYLKKGSVE